MSASRHTLRVAGLLIYAAVTFLLMLHHEPWRDETHAWLLARGPASYTQLLVEIRDGEVQPPLWHLLLRLVSSFTDSFFVVGVLHWLVMVAAVGLLLWRAPLAWYEVALIGLSYFFIFEYAVVIRHYGLSVLLFFAILAVRGRNRSAYLLRGLLLAPLALSNTCGTALATACWLAGLARRDRRGGWGDAVALTALACAAYYLAGEAAHDVSSWLAAPSQRPYAAWEEGLGALAVRMLFQMRHLPDWQPAWMLKAPALYALALAGLVLVITAAPKRGRAGAFMGLATAALLAVFLLAGRGAYLRHHGFLWIALVGALWMEREDGGRPGAWRRGAWFTLLAGSLWSTALVVKAEWNCLYSEAGRTAEQLLALDRDAGVRALWVSADSGICEGILAFLPRDRAEFYSLELDRPFRYLVHNQAWKSLDHAGWSADDARVVEAFDRVMRASGRRTGYLIRAGTPLDLERAGHGPVVAIKKDEPPCVMTHRERFYLYAWRNTE